MTNYDNTPMTGITAGDYETLLTHLSEQLAAVIGGDQASDAACDALSNTWNDEMTAREWLTAAGTRLGYDTSACVGV